MSEYKDSKGITHQAETLRDLANRQYLDDERKGREGAIRLQGAILAAQEEQVEIQRSRAAVESQHFAAEQQDRELTRDIQWLERCDDKGKLDYLVQKALNAYKSGSQDDLNSMRIRLQAHWSVLLLDKLTAGNADTAESQIVSATTRLSSMLPQLTTAKLAVDGARIRAKTAEGLLSVQPASEVGLFTQICFLAALIMPYLIWTEWKEGRPENCIVALAFGVILLFPSYLTWRKEARREAHKKLSDQQSAEVTKEFVAAESRFSIVLRDAVIHRDAWLRLAKRDYTDWIDAQLKEPDAIIDFCAVLEALQERYPPLCRVQFTTMSAVDLEVAFTPLRTQIFNLEYGDLMRYCAKAVIGKGKDPIAGQCFEALTKEPESAAQDLPPPLPTPPHLRPAARP